MSDLHHSIKVVAKRSGLTPHVIRVWERRYGAVQPQRTGTNRRAYTDADIERLSLLGQATMSGHNIGSVAKLPTEELRKLVATTNAETALHAPTHSTVVGSFREEAMKAVRKLDSQALEAVLNRAVVVLGHQGLLEKLVVPLAHQVGELWRSGEITAAHEHFASAVIRVFLGHAGRPFVTGDTVPNLVVATPTGQLHELGAVIVAAAATNLGWQVTYLGTGLPAAEIAGAAIQNRTRAVALSLVYPEDDPNLPQELKALRRFLPAEIKIMAGGRAAPAYRQTLNQIGAIQLDSVQQLYPVLDSLRLTKL